VSAISIAVMAKTNASGAVYRTSVAATAALTVGAFITSIDSWESDTWTSCTGY
jgi:hypothetical protein